MARQDLMRRGARRRRPNQSGTVLPTDVNAVVRRTMQVLSSERSSEQLTVDISIDAALPRASIEPEQLRQVLMNLYRNAAQAMKGRGLGLTSMKERVALVGGQLSIESQLQNGTTVYVRVPLPSTTKSAHSAG